MEYIYYPDHVIDTNYLNDSVDLLKLKEFYENEVQTQGKLFKESPLNLLAAIKLQCANSQLHLINSELSKINISELNDISMETQGNVEQLQNEINELRKEVEILKLHVKIKAPAKPRTKKTTN